KRRRSRLATSQQLIKESNLSLILKLIDSHEPISRAELAQMTKLSPTTVSSLIEELIEEGLVIETGEGKSETSGRKPIMLTIKSDGRYVICIDIVKEDFKCLIYDLKCNERADKTYSIKDYDNIGSEIAESIKENIELASIPEDKIIGICISIPGLIDEESKRVMSTVIPIDEDNDFYEVIAERFDYPVFLMNQSCLYAYAEKQFGSKEQIKNLVFIDINVGIGAGIITDGDIFNGAYGIAGEIGHMSLDINGTRCKCGNRGCLETIASIPAIFQNIVFGIMAGRETIIKDMIGNDYNSLTIEMIRRALDEGDEFIIELIDDIARKLAFGINNVVNILNPDFVIIGGRIRRFGMELLDRIKHHFHSIAFKSNRDKLTIKYSNIEKNAVGLGGARYTIDTTFGFN
ncbi:MAG: ROK family transcriptional regulator, partial [Clostridiales bacterium]|nr:ROK family transcriptional regulator [Clostridiales bacterium]